MARKEIPPEAFLAGLPLFKALDAAALARLALTNADRGGSSPEARALLERIAAGANA